jgi:hypothetical protein
MFNLKLKIMSEESTMKVLKDEVPTEESKQPKMNPQQQKAYEAEMRKLIKLRQTETKDEADYWENMFKILYFRQKVGKEEENIKRNIKEALNQALIYLNMQDKLIEVYTHLGLVKDNPVEPHLVEETEVKN